MSSIVHLVCLGLTPMKFLMVIFLQVLLAKRIQILPTPILDHHITELAFKTRVNVNGDLPRWQTAGQYFNLCFNNRLIGKCFLKMTFKKPFPLNNQ